MKHRTNPARLRSGFPAAAVIFGAVIAVAIGGASLPVNALTAPSPATLTAGSQNLWGASAPRDGVVDGDKSSVELGTDFSPSATGTVVGVRFWKTAANSGAHVGNLWTSGGTRLATAKFTSETASGWQTVLFAKPVALSAGKHYVASYLAPRGRYTTTVDQNAPAVSSKFLSVDATNSGRYIYGSSSAFPTKTWRSSGYWVDPLFVPAASATGTASPSPTPTTSPAPAPTPAPAPAPSTTPAPTPTATPAPAPTTTPVPTPTTALVSAQSTSASFAGSSNTGPIAAGFNPTQKYTGPLTITTPGTVIKNQIIPAGLRIEASDVTIQGNIIEGPTDVSWDQAAVHVNGDRVKILDNTIRGNSATDWSQDPINGIKLVGQYVDFSRNNVYGIAGDGVSIYGDNANVVGNWVHDFVFRDGGVHYDGLHYPGQAGDSTYAPALIKDNTVELWVSGGSSGMTAAMGFPDVAPKVVVDHNLLAGGNYAMWGGGSGITYTNNWFWTKFSPNVGYYGPSAYIGQVGSATWTGNVSTADGKIAGSTLGK